MNMMKPLHLDDSFGILRAKIVDHVLAVLGFRDEGAFICLLDLKFQEVRLLVHHQHLKLSFHEFTKLPFAKRTQKEFAIN